MLSVPVYSMKGDRIGAMEVDAEALGGAVRPTLIKQAVVAFLDHQRQHSARTKGRSQTAGSTRKLYRQKGTGNARAGTIRTPVRRGGGRAFAKRVPGSVKEIPKKVRRLACCNAVLSRIEDSDVLVIDNFKLNEAKTKSFVGVMNAIDVKNGCVLAMHERDKNIFLSGRNIERTEIRHVDDLNAYDVMLRPKLVFTKPAFEQFVRRAASWRGAGE